MNNSGERLAVFGSPAAKASIKRRDLREHLLSVSESLDNDNVALVEASQSFSGAVLEAIEPIVTKENDTSIYKVQRDPSKIVELDITNPEAAVLDGAFQEMLVRIPNIEFWHDDSTDGVDYSCYSMTLPVNGNGQLQAVRITRADRAVAGHEAVVYSVATTLL